MFAVTAILFRRFLARRINSFIKYVLPVPAAPVSGTDWLDSKIAKASVCVIDLYCTKELLPKALFIYAERVYGINNMEYRPLPRINGTEMEWGGMTSSHPNSSELRQANVHEFMPAVDEFLYDRDIPYLENFSGNYFLANGARFYNDLGESREYATPEDDSFIGTTANEIAGDSILSGIADIYYRQNERRISFNKRVIDDAGESRGYHASYAVNAERIGINESSLALFGVFAATRSVLFGSGALLPYGKFTIAQKALSLGCDFHHSTTGNKPLVNLREEPLADDNFFARVHDTSGDPTMSPWATRVKLGAASIVLKLIENGVTMEHLRFEDDLYSVAQRVARDPSLSEGFRLITGRYVNAIDTQQQLMFTSKKLMEHNEIPFTNEEVWTIHEWEKALADLRQNPRLTVDRIDWTMRQEILKQQHERHGWGWNSQRLRYKDRQFSDVAIDGIALALRETVWAKHMPSEELITERLHKPPATTRANIRSAFIEKICRLGLDYNAKADWDRVAFLDNTIMLRNPYQSQDTTVDNFLYWITDRYGPDASLA
jgi:proteasome accessory factor A